MGIAVTHIVFFWFDRFLGGTFLLFFVGDIFFLGALNCTRHCNLLKPLLSFSPCLFSNALLGPISLQWTLWVRAKILPRQLPSWGPTSKEIAFVNAELALSIFLYFAPSLLQQASACGLVEV